MPCLGGNILIGSGKVLVQESYWGKVSPPPKVVSVAVAGGWWRWCPAQPRNVYLISAN